MPLPTIVVFDFDGTITRRDSFMDFILFARGWAVLFFAFAFSLPYLVGYAGGIASAHRLKEAVFRFCFAGCSVSRFETWAKAYASRRLPRLLRSSALAEITRHRERGEKLVIASASIEDWIKPWADKHSFDAVLATRVETRAGSLTGHFATLNCKGEEKRRRFLALFPNRRDYRLIVYTDNASDKPLLDLADEYFYRKFHE